MWNKKETDQSDLGLVYPTPKKKRYTKNSDIPPTKTRPNTSKGPRVFTY